MSAACLHRLSAETWYDKFFLSRVPKKEQKPFLTSFRILNSVGRELVWEKLFVGIKKPFDYVDTSGWMKRLLHDGQFEPSASSFADCARILDVKFKWPRHHAILLVPECRDRVYTASWGRFLTYLAKGWLNLDTVLICHPRNKECTIFWEGSGPIIGVRATRELPDPLQMKTESADAADAITSEEPCGKVDNCNE